MFRQLVAVAARPASLQHGSTTTLATSSRVVARASRIAHVHNHQYHHSSLLTRRVVVGSASAASTLLDRSVLFKYSTLRDSTFDTSLGSSTTDSSSTSPSSLVMPITASTGTCVTPPPLGIDANAPIEDADFMPYPSTVVGKARYYYEAYASLSKLKLSMLVLATTMWGYSMAPGAVLLQPLLASMLGTGMTIASACTINQIMEVSNDSQMYRTRKRWLPAGRISKLHASTFGMSGIPLNVVHSKHYH
jgi:hypothetical protein